MNTSEVLNKLDQEFNGYLHGESEVGYTDLYSRRMNQLKENTLGFITHLGTNGASFYCKNEFQEVPNKIQRGDMCMLVSIFFGDIIDFADDENMPYMTFDTVRYSHTKERSIYFVDSGQVILDPLKAYIDQPDYRRNVKITDILENPLKYQKRVEEGKDSHFAKNIMDATKETFLHDPEWVSKFVKRNRRKPDMHDISDIAASVTGSSEDRLYNKVDMDEEELCDIIIIQSNKLRANISDSIAKVYGDSIEFKSYYEK